MARIIGRRLVVCDVYEDGREVQTKSTFKPLAPPISSLRDVWVRGASLTFDLFVERCSNGLVENGRVWTGGSLSIIETYNFLTEVGCIKRHLKIETVYVAFKGTFIIPKVNTPRALRDRESTGTKTYRDRRRAFRNFLCNLFLEFCSENMNGTNRVGNLHNDLNRD